MTSRAEEAFRLGDEWLVEPRLRRVTGPSGPVQVEPKLVEVLARLAREPGRVVSPDELLEEVWGGAQVSEEVVRRAIYELRKLLGDRAEAPRFLETIPRSGYRLIAPVTRDTGTRARPRLRWVTGAVGLGLASLAAVAALVLLPGEAKQAEAPLRLTPFTAYDGLEYDPAFSPDGSRIAFVRARSDGLEPVLHVKLVGSESAIALAADGELPAWAPDGGHVAFVRRVRGAESSHWEIQEVPALGGATRRLADLADRRPYGLARSPDGRRLAFGWSEQPGAPYGIFVVDLATGSRRRLTRPPSGTGGDGDPTWSPDGRTLAFVRNTFGTIQDLYTVPAAGGEARRITPASRKIPDVVWSPDGRRLFYTVYDAGDHRLWSIPADGGGPAEAVGAGEGAMTLSLDAAGRRIAYSRYAWRFRFWRLGLESGRSEHLPLLSSSRFDGELAVSRDGSRLAFVSTRSGDFEIWVSRADGSEARRLTDFRGALVSEPSWSPDGRWLVFCSTASGDADLWKVDVLGGIPEPITSSSWLEVTPRWSADGRWVYYGSNRTGRWEVWRLPADGRGEPERVTRGGGRRGVESPDGRWLYFTRRGDGGGRGLWRQPTAGGGGGDAGAELLVPDLGREGVSDWAVSSSGVYLVGKGEDHSPVLLLLDPESGETRRMSALEEWPLAPSLALAADGSWLVYTQAYGVESDIVIAEGVF